MNRCTSVRLATADEERCYGSLTDGFGPELRCNIASMQAASRGSGAGSKALDTLGLDRATPDIEKLVFTAVARIVTPGIRRPPYARFSTHRPPD